MVYPKARALRLSLAKVWNLPKEEDLRETWPEWALNILDNQDDKMRCKSCFSGGELGTFEIIPSLVTGKPRFTILPVS
jgi:hypothetical protein